VEHVSFSCRSSSCFWYLVWVDSDGCMAVPRKETVVNKQQKLDKMVVTNLKQIIWLVKNRFIPFFTLVLLRSTYRSLFHAFSCCYYDNNYSLFCPKLPEYCEKSRGAHFCRVPMRPWKSLNLSSSSLKVLELICWQLLTWLHAILHLASRYASNV